MTRPFYKSFIISYILTLGVLASCDRPECINTNPVFLELSPTDEAYKAELVNQLQHVNREDLRFWFDSYIEINEEPSLICNIQGSNLCAKIILSTTKWAALEDVVKKKGVSYHGAELQGLTFDIVQEEKIAFIYKDVQKIVD